MRGCSGVMARFTVGQLAMALPGKDTSKSGNTGRGAHSPSRGSIVGRTALEGQPVQIVDVLADPEYVLLDLQKIGNYRTVLGIPLLREGLPIGVLVLTRSEPRPFTNKQIELLTTFADQAVIAIENVRLFEAEQQRTRELVDGRAADSYFRGAAGH